jgi:hypothetical protein
MKLIMNIKHGGGQGGHTILKKMTMQTKKNQLWTSNPKMKIMPWRLENK